MTNRISLVAALAVVFPLGCYSGIDNPAASVATDAADDTGTSSEATGETPDPEHPTDDDADPPDDGPGPVEDPFEVPNHEVRLLPFGVRMTNLATLVGVDTDHFIFDDLYVRRTLLGDHDYANGVAPDLSWSPTKMSVWVKGVKPVCNSAQWLAAHPKLSADPAPLLREILAREPDSDELATYQELAISAVATANADELICLAALSSLDFVAQ